MNDVNPSRASAGANDRSTSVIRRTPGVCGGEACIRETRITVSGLVEWRKLGLSDSEILERVAGLSQADLDAAWRYYDDHPSEIDEAIRQNHEA